MNALMLMTIHPTRTLTQVFETSLRDFNRAYVYPFQKIHLRSILAANIISTPVSARNVTLRSGLFTYFDVFASSSVRFTALRSSSHRAILYIRTSMHYSVLASSLAISAMNLTVSIETTM